MIFLKNSLTWPPIFATFWGSFGRFCVFGVPTVRFWLNEKLFCQIRGHDETMPIFRPRGVKILWITKIANWSIPTGPFWYIYVKISILEFRKTAQKEVLTAEFGKMIFLKKIRQKNRDFYSLTWPPIFATFWGSFGWFCVFGVPTVRFWLNEKLFCQIR